MRVDHGFDATMTLAPANYKFGRATFLHVGKPVGHSRVYIDSVVAAPQYTVATDSHEINDLGLTDNNWFFNQNVSVVVALLVKVCRPAVLCVCDMY